MELCSAVIYRPCAELYLFIAEKRGENVDEKKMTPPAAGIVPQENKRVGFRVSRATTTPRAHAYYKE